MSDETDHGRAPTHEPGSEPTDAAPNRDAQAFPPDPAGTRPKPVARALTAAEPLAGDLGQTFRAPVTAGSPPESVGSIDQPIEVALPASPHASRFQFILGALLALGLSAVAITAYTLNTGRDRIPADWSSWHPTATGIGAATQIANHVASEYRLADGGQMLAVKGGPLVLAGVPVTIALKTGNVATGGISVLAGSGVLYKMCGLGQGCSITGKPSAERLRLVRREALELALYTFEYVGGADQVVVFLPPVLQATPVAGQPNKVKTTTDSTNAVFFRASDLSGELGHPLESTLTRQAPSLTTVDGAADTPVVNALTGPSLYKFSFVQTSQDESLFLVLAPFTAAK